MRKSWQPTPQECELLIDMLAANRSKPAIAKFLYISESTVRRFLARAGWLATLAQNENGEKPEYGARLGRGGQNEGA